jgi:putative transport protein
MEWLLHLVVQPSVGQALLWMSVIIALGVGLGHLSFRGISLGIGGVLFSGLLLGDLASRSGIHLEGEVLHFLREFGLILFVYTVGLQVGPGFVGSLRRYGLNLNLAAAAIVIGGAVMVVILAKGFGVHYDAMAGMFSGATTNTPSLGAAQEALRTAGQLGPEALAASLQVTGMSYAVAYPFGICGIILVMLLLQRLGRVDVDQELAALAAAAPQPPRLQKRNLVVSNDNVVGKPLGSLPPIKNNVLRVTRVAHAGTARIAQGEHFLHRDDVLTVVGRGEDIDDFMLLIGGETEVDPVALSEDMTVERLVVTHMAVIGRTVPELGLELTCNIVASRILRTGIELTPDATTPLQYGDRLQVVGNPKAIHAAEALVGNQVGDLDRPRIVPVLIGIALGIILGSIPVALPGLPAPVKLGLAGGPLLVAILVANLHKVGPLVFHLPTSANHVLRELGICFFLAVVGFNSGGAFLETLLNGDGLLWMGLAALVTFVPLMAVGLVMRRVFKTNYIATCGLLAGSMTDPPALAFAQKLAGGNAPAVAYAAVYPLTMVLRIVCGQLLILLFL